MKYKNMSNNVLYIIAPCFNEQEVLPQSSEILINLLNSMIKSSLISDDSRILFVDDGSSDNTWNIISELADLKKVCAIKLAANAGHQNALLAGLEYSVKYADMMITIDADLQDDINAIPQMVQRFNNGIDVVYGVRRERKTDSWFKRNTALCFYKLMQKLGVKSVFNHADFRLMSKRSVMSLLQFGERNLFLRGLVPLVGYPTDYVYYNRSARMAGESKYPLRKMLNFAVDGITSFSVKPVRMVLSIGLIFVFIAICIFVYTLASYLNGKAISGWASIILSIWFIGGCILIGLGIIGEYIGKIYIEVKRRPRFIIEKYLGNDN